MHQQQNQDTLIDAIYHFEIFTHRQTSPTCLPEERGGVLHVEEELLGGGEAVLHAGHLLVEVEDEDQQRPEADHQEAEHGHPQGARPAHRVAAASPPRLGIAVLRHSAILAIQLTLRREEKLMI